MRLPVKLPWPEAAPYEAAVQRLRARLTVDAVVLRHLRRAARNGGGRELSAYGWALGVAPEALTRTAPTSMAAALESAAECEPEQAAVQFASGLANAGGFSRRRGLSLAARQGFTAAARLDPQNLLGHLAGALARASTGDRPAALTAYAAATACSEFRLYRSPLSAILQAEAPWLAESLVLWWPDRVCELVRSAVDERVQAVLRAAARQRAANEPLAILERLARQMVAAADTDLTVAVLAAGAFQRALRLRAERLSDAAAAAASEQVAATMDTLAAGRRALAHDFERAVQRQLGAAGGGAAAGLATMIGGLVRSGRRWPPPWPMALGRQWAWLGLGVSLASLASVLVPNPAAAAYRRQVERRLAARQQVLVQQALAGLRQVAAELPVPGEATGETAAAEAAPARE